MRPFAYATTTDRKAASATLVQDPHARFIAGGTNVLDLMKDDVEGPSVLVDINALPYHAIERTVKGIRIGALARMNDVADHPDVKALAPAVSSALAQSASAQLRNMASIGGNIMQRTRCAYFRDVATSCNKRSPGSGCTAIGGENRQHAVLGTSDHCICTNASDFAVAFLALDGVVQTIGANGVARTIPAGHFHVLPNPDPAIETVLHAGEMIVALDIPASAVARNSTYLKVRDRASYQFALVSAAAGLTLEGGTIREARLALGGVAPVPWRASAAEAMLVGHAPSRKLFEAAAKTALVGAVGRGKNDFKIALAQRAIVRALATVGGVA